jgi:nucleoside-diphosphate-sugar epimerase
MTAAGARPIVLVTGAAGHLGRSVAKALADGYRIGLDRQARAMGAGGQGGQRPDDSFPILAVDLGSDGSVNSALPSLRDDHGSRIASVVHLAHSNFTGEDNPLYPSVNVEGTQRLLRALQGFEVGQFLYPSTMLVHAPCRPGEHIDETPPLAPAWAYPESKAAAEAVLREAQEHTPSLSTANG